MQASFWICKSLPPSATLEVVPVAPVAEGLDKAPETPSDAILRENAPLADDFPAAEPVENASNSWQDRVEVILAVDRRGNVHRLINAG
jgi:hypothetical protein